MSAWKDLTSSQRAQVRLAVSATHLREAAAAYRSAWSSQRHAERAMGEARRYMQDAFGQALPRPVGDGLSAVDAATANAELLTLDLDSDGALEEMNRGTEQLEAVAKAVLALAEALAKEGGLQ